MSPRVTLAYGRSALDIELPDGCVVITPPTMVEPPPVAELLTDALDSPIGADPLETLVNRGDRVLLITSDHTRPDPRGALLDAVFERLPRGVEVAAAVASGTHSLGDVSALGLPSWLPHVFQSDAHDPSQFAEVGVTRRGTPIRINRIALEADVIIATGAIRPHYFAGFGAGSKAIFPGLGENESVRINHRLKIEPGARPGVVEGNPCRADLEEVLDMLDARCYLLDAVEGPDRRIHAAVAGDPRAAFRAGAERCRPLFTTPAPRTKQLVLSDRDPLASSLYQATKMVAMAAELVAPGGVVVLAAECADGTGPKQVVNQGIYEIGVKPRLPVEHRVALISSLDRAEVEQTYCEWAASVEALLDGPALVVPDCAGSLLYEVSKTSL